jgi:hypothetical protein
MISCESKVEKRRVKELNAGIKDNVQSEQLRALVFLKALKWIGAKARKFSLKAMRRFCEVHLYSMRR